MNHWKTLLQACPATLLTLIARHHRISLPRRCSPSERVDRIHESLMHGAIVRTTYFGQDASIRAAIHALRSVRGGMRMSQVRERYGAIRSWNAMKADPRPHSISERLLLLRWLVPRGAMTSPDTRLVVPREVRQW